MKKLITIITLIICILGLNADAGINTSAAYVSTQIYSMEGTPTNCGGLVFDGGMVYVGDDTMIKSIDTQNGNAVSTAGNLGTTAGISFVARRDGVTYTAYTTSKGAPYPAKVGYINASGHYQNHQDLDGIFDAAFNASGSCYLVANPGATGSRIYFYDHVGGTVSEVANMGGYSGGVTFDASGNLYYADQTSGNILRFSDSQLQTGNLTASDGEVVLSSLYAGYIGFDENGNFFATASYGYKFGKYDIVTGTMLEEIASSDSFGLGKFAFDNDTIYIGNTNWYDDYSIYEVVAVPEPASMILLGLGAMLLRKGRK